MSPIRLVRVAAEAESLRLRAMVGRFVRRIVFGVVALVFLLAVLVFVHIIGFHALTESAQFSFYVACLIVGGVDLLLALIFLMLAGQSKPSASEQEAYAVRQQALDGMRRFGTYSQLALPALRMATSMRRRKLRVGRR